MATPTLNRAEFIGRLTRDPELRHTPSGVAVANFGLAINRTFNTEGGERGESTVFLEVQAWESKATLCHDYLQRGDLVFVDGRIDMDKWEEKETGRNRSKLFLVLNNVQFLSTPREDQGAGDEAPAKPAPNRGDVPPAGSAETQPKKGARAKKPGAGQEA